MLHRFLFRVLTDSSNPDPRGHMRTQLGKRDAAKVVYDELFLQPWFLPKATYLKLRRILPSSQMAKMRYYFEDYGCLKCGDRNALYASNGLCKGCSIIVRSRVVLALKRRFRRLGAKIERTTLKQFLAQVKNAGPTP